MDQRDRVERRRFPFRRRPQRIVDLHVAFAVAVLRHGIGDVGRQLRIGEEPPVEAGWA
jgi:hypothetical protein